MSYARDFYDWGSHNYGKEWVQFGSCSPNLLVIFDELKRRWPVSATLGCFNPVRIPGSTFWSTHAWGAAIDVSYGPAGDRTDAEQIIGFLVGWSNELHVQAVHDYERQRIWRAGRTPDLEDACTGWWKAQRTSAEDPMGKPWATWLHIETTPSGWKDGTPIAVRGVL